MEQRKKKTGKKAAPAKAKPADGVTVEETTLEALDFLEGNPRVHDDDQIALIRTSLEEDGPGRSIVASRGAGGRRHVIAGNGTKRAALEAGLTRAFLVTAPRDGLVVVVRDDLDEQAQVRMAIRDNLATDHSSFGSEELRQAAEGASLLLADLGFSSAELARYAGNRASDDPKKEWDGMPEFDHGDETAFQSIHIHFADERAVRTFSKLIKQPITPKTRSLWYPPAKIGTTREKTYGEEPAPEAKGGKK